MLIFALVQTVFFALHLNSPCTPEQFFLWDHYHFSIFCWLRPRADLVPNEKFQTFIFGKVVANIFLILSLWIQRAWIVILVAIILPSLDLLPRIICFIHLFRLLSSIVFYFMLVRTHSKNHTLNVLILWALIIGRGNTIDNQWNNLLIGALSRLHSLKVLIGLMLTAWYNGLLHVLVCLLLYGLMIFIFVRLLFALHNDKLVSCQSFANQVKMKPYQVDQQDSKKAN